MSGITISKFSKTNIVLSLAFIGVISVIFKLYLADFTVPVFSDALEYTQHSISISQGQFLQHPQRHSGWPFLQSIFMIFLNTENFLDYSNTSKILSISVSTLTIIPVYLLSNRYFDSRFALLATAFFAFEPRLIQNSTLGFSEPLFIFIMVFSIFCATKNEKKFLILSFILAGILWWIRPNGFILFFMITVIYFVRFRFSKKTIQNLLIYSFIFSLIITPLLLQRYEQFGDPMYNWIGERIWVGEYSHSRSLVSGDSYSYLDFISDNGLQSFFKEFIFDGSLTLFSTLSYMMLPYLVFLAPSGMIFCLKNRISNNSLFPISFVLLISLLASVIPFTVIPDKRLILYVFPFLIIFSTLSLNYFFNKISFFNNHSKLFFIIIFSLLIITSSFMISRYTKSEQLSEQEQLDFTKFLIKNFEGKLLFEPFNTQKYFNHPSIYEKPDTFLSIKITENWKEGDPFFDYPTQKLSRISVYGENIRELLENGEKRGLTHIMVTPESTSFFDFVNQLYFEENKYPFLTLVYDSTYFDHKYFHVKVFEINYSEFHKFYSVT